MIDWNNSQPDERIQQWSKFRQSISELDAHNQMQQIAELTSTMPIGGRCVDYYEPDSWPSPWEILYHELYCRSTAGILMYDTALILNTDVHLELAVIDDRNDVYIAPVLEKTQLINVVLGEIISWHDHKDIEVVYDLGQPARKH